MLTREQVKPWLENMDEGRLLDMLREHHFIKQQICANELGVLTGAEDWPKIASQRARDLRNCENELRIFIKGKHSWNLHPTRNGEKRECPKCGGTVIANNTCQGCMYSPKNS